MKEFLINVKNFIMCPNRINRISFLIRFLFWLIIVPCITVQTTKLGLILFNIKAECIYLIVGILMIVGMLRAIFSRLHDCNLHSGYLLLGFVPLLLLGVIAWLFFCSGTKGPNKYGDEPTSWFKPKIRYLKNSL